MRFSFKEALINLRAFELPDPAAAINEPSVIRDEDESNMSLTFLISLEFF